MLTVKLKKVVSGLVRCSPGFKTVVVVVVVVVVVDDHSYPALSSALEQNH